MDITILEQEFSRAGQDPGHNQKHEQGHEKDTLETKLMRGDIPRVLERIVRFLPVKSLKQCRLINTDWNKIATLQLQHDMDELYFTNVDKIQLFLDLDLVSNSKVTPFVKFHIQLGDIKSKTLLDTLFRTIAPVATHLTIRIDISGDGYNLDLNISKQLQFSSLTSMMLTVFESASREVSSGRVMSKEKLQQKMGAVFRILEKMRLLKSLEWNIDTKTTLLNRRVLKRLIKTLVRKSNCELLHLGITCRGFQDCQFERLTDISLDLSLTSFSLWGPFVDESTNYEDQEQGRGGNGSALINFLIDQSNSLLKLDLRWMVGLFDRLEFPRFPKLTSLTVLGWHPLVRDPEFQFPVRPSINYSSVFPALKKVELDSFGSEEWGHFLPVKTFQPVLSVERLHLPKEVDNESEAKVYIQHAMDFFPNLKVLRLAANLSFANIVYKSLPNLEELILSVHDLVQSIDDIITGFTLEQLQSSDLYTVEGFLIQEELQRLSLSMKEREQTQSESSLWPLSTLKSEYTNENANVICSK